MASPQVLTQGLDAMTSQLQALVPVAQQINIVNAPLMLIGQGPLVQVITGLTMVITTATGQASALSYDKTDNYDANADAIVASVQAYTQASQALMTALIGKAPLLKTVPFIGPPLATVLRSLDGADDTIIFQLIDKTPSKKDELVKLGNSVDDLQNQAITAFSDSL